MVVILVCSIFYNWGDNSMKNANGNKGRATGSCQIDGRRCCKCKKVAKDLIDGEYLCRVHSPMRKGFKR